MQYVLLQFFSEISPPSETIYLSGYGMGFWVFSDIILDICED
jgi:hypothetical protein